MTDQEMIATESSLIDENVVLSNQARAGGPLGARVSSSSLGVVPQKTQRQLLRMFADSSVLGKHERADLVRDLRECVKANPQVSDLRVLFGMALCINFEVPDAIEELREGVRLAPHSFIANLIMGELVVGVFLGPGAANLLHLHLFAGGQAPGALMLLAQVGGFVLMFLAGVETDVDRMREAGTTAFLVALFGVIWPFLLGAAVGHLFGLSWITACFLGGALTATSVSISARTLMDAGQMSSHDATVTLGVVVISHVMA